MRNNKIAIFCLYELSSKLNEYFYKYFREKILKEKYGYRPKDIDESDDAFQAYEKAFNTSMKGMSSSYGKFAKEAEKLGIKVKKSQGFGKGESVSDFSKKDVETRTRLIKLTERMAKDEKAKLKNIAKGSAAYKRQVAEVEALENQGKAMRNLNDDIIQQEKKTDKIKRKSAKAERKAENTKIRKQKQIVAGLKNIQMNTAKIGKATINGPGLSKGIKPSAPNRATI